jgi:hypothetical protein
MTWAAFSFGYVLIPLVALAYVLLASWATYRITRKPKLFGRKVLAASLVGLFFIAIPTWDIALGRLELTTLCKSEATVRVFRAVPLDKQYLSDDGSPKTELITGRAAYRIGQQYIMSSTQEEVFSWPRITKSRTEIRDTRNNELLGEVVDFRYWGGWLINQMPGQPRARTCPELLQDRGSLHRLVFSAAR